MGAEVLLLFRFLVRLIEGHVPSVLAVDYGLK